MHAEGPQLESLARRLADCPPEFLLAPKVNATGVGEIDVRAVVSDHLRAMGMSVFPADAEELFRVGSGMATVNRLHMIALAAWLLHDEWFLSRRDLAEEMWKTLSRGLDGFASLVKAPDVVGDADRREEFIRVCLKRLGLRPRGETLSQATDRLSTFDSAERLRVLEETREAEARAREIREQMAKKAAEAAAARYSPE